MRKWIKTSTGYIKTELKEIEKITSDYSNKIAGLEKHIDDLYDLKFDREQNLAELEEAIIAAGDNVEDVPQYARVVQKIEQGNLAISKNEELLSEIVEKKNDEIAKLSELYDGGLTIPTEEEKEAAEAARQAAKDKLKADRKKDVSNITETKPIESFTKKQLIEIASILEIEVSGLKPEILQTLIDAGVTEWPQT